MQQPNRIDIQFSLLILLSFTLISCSTSLPDGGNGITTIQSLPESDKCLHELSSDWEYYPGLFVNGTGFALPEAVARKTLVDFSNNDQRKAAWKAYFPYDGYDFGTYRMNIGFQEADPGILLVRIPYFDMAVAVYIQGKPVFSNSTESVERAGVRPVTHHPVIVEAEAEDGKIEIVIHAANYHFPLWGTRDYPVIGDADSLTRYILRQTYMEALLVGALVIMVLANLILFLLSQDRQSPVYLLLLSLTALLLNLTNGNAVLGQLGLGWEVMNRIIYFALSVEFLFMGVYIFHQLVSDRKKSNLAKLAYTAARMPFIALIAATPISLFSVAYHVHAALTVSVMVWAMLAAAWRGFRGEARFVFISLTILLLLLFFRVDSTQPLRVNRYSYASPYGVALFSVLNIGMLAWRVRGFSAELETQIAERTRELVHERQQVEAKVRDAVREIREKDDLLNLQSRQAATGEMIDFIAHQWKQSLYAISLHSELLRSRIRQDGTVGMDFAKKPLDSIQLVMDEMVRGMDVLRNFASPTRQAELFVLAEAANETITLLRDMFSVKRVGLRLEGDRSAAVYGSSQELKQVLMNLLVNALEAIRRDPDRRGMVSIRVRTEASAASDCFDGVAAVVEVEDDGGGIPPELLDGLFQKYTTSKPSGNGLGLYLSRMIVERHFGGSISARNRDGGALFTLRLPCASNFLDTGKHAAQILPVP